jgi:hypothetical protein
MGAQRVINGKKVRGERGGAADVVDDELSLGAGRVRPAAVPLAAPSAWNVAPSAAMVGLSES